MSGKKLEQYGDGGGGLGVCPVRGGGTVDRSAAYMACTGNYLINAKCTHKRERARTTETY